MIVFSNMVLAQKSELINWDYVKFESKADFAKRAKDLNQWYPDDVTAVSADADDKRSQYTLRFKREGEYFGDKYTYYFDEEKCYRIILPFLNGQESYVSSFFVLKKEKEEGNQLIKTYEGNGVILTHLQVIVDTGFEKRVDKEFYWVEK